MKTKFLNFKKLPKIDPLNSRTPDKFKENESYIPHDPHTSTPIRADSAKTGDFFDLFEILLKRMPQPQSYVL